MITLKKILTLKGRVQIRKIASVFRSRERLDDDYKRGLIDILTNSDELTDDDKKRALYLIEKEDYDGLYYALMDSLGESYADWDFYDEKTSDPLRRRVFEHRVYLDGIRSPYNVGSIFRSSEFFGVKEIILSPSTPSPMHDRSKRTSMGTVDIIPYSYRDIDEIEGNIFALELHGEGIGSFEFPRDGICIVGSEEGGVSKRALDRAKESYGVVSIEGYGSKASLNVSAALSILLEHWAESEREN